MRTTTFITMLTVLVGSTMLVGCNTDENEEGKTLSLVKVADQSLAQGETNKIMLTVTRGGGFEGAVEVELRNLPSGVTVVEDSFRIPASDNVINLTLHAANDADLVENHRAEAVARGPDLETSQTFSITVTAKDEDE